MQTIPDTYIMQLTRDDVNAIRRDLVKLKDSLKGEYWDSVKKEYPALMTVWFNLPSVEKFRD